MRNSTCERDPAMTFGRRSQRPVSDEGKGSLATPFERSSEAQDVLALRERAETEECGSLRIPADLAASVAGGARREALEVDATVHDVRLPGSRGDLPLELHSEPLGHGDDRSGTTNDVAGRGTSSWNGPDVDHVLTVCGDDERRP